MTSILEALESPTELGSTEVQDWREDFTSRLQTGQTVQSAAVTVTDLTDGTDVSATVLGTPAPASPYVTVPVDGRQMTVGHRYRLVATATLSDGTAEALFIDVRCSL